ncbi:hypothetical protein [Desulfovibrio sp. Huiquan2017]|uniref:hypothetical protein n=1 Tax=Desulfovibrio sp. Huiquan2017 TaxID=2816861 RepID=UPI001A9156C7|nr:hypothetical protein [Desulfovibrio sp. Huiquan2017]
MQESSISAKELVQALLGVIGECFDGAREHGAFLNPDEGGLLALLGGLSARQASTPVAGDSVATHALHLSFSLDVFTDWISGVRDKTYDWEKSWSQNSVDEQEWRALLDHMAAQAKTLGKAIGNRAPVDPDAAWGAFGALAHTAFHLGAVQVKVDVLRNNG